MALYELDGQCRLSNAWSIWLEPRLTHYKRIRAHHHRQRQQACIPAGTQPVQPGGH